MHKLPLCISQLLLLARPSCVLSAHGEWIKTQPAARLHAIAGWIHLSKYEFVSGDAAWYRPSASGPRRAVCIRNGCCNSAMDARRVAFLEPCACSARTCCTGCHKQYYRFYATIPPGNCQFQRKKILYDLFKILLCIISSYLYIFLIETSNVARF